MLRSLISKRIQLTGRIVDKVRRSQLRAGIPDQGRVGERMRLVYDEVIDAVDLVGLDDGDGRDRG